MAAGHLSSASSVFLASAEDLVRRLAGDTSSEALALSQEANQLLDVVRHWQTERPSDDVRVTTIQRLFDLNRRVLDHLSKTHPPSSGLRGKRPAGDG